MAINIDFWSMDTPDLDVMEAAAGAALSLGAPFVVNRRSEAVLQVYWAFEGADGEPAFLARANVRSEEHTSELQSLMRISYAVFCLKKKKKIQRQQTKTKI